jgi:hypothetical protein
MSLNGPNAKATSIDLSSIASFLLLTHDFTTTLSLASSDKGAGSR